MCKVDRYNSTDRIRTTFCISAGRPHTGYNMLYPLEGAIRGIRWYTLEKEELHNIREEYDRHCDESLCETEYIQILKLCKNKSLKILNQVQDDEFTYRTRDNYEG